MLDSTCTSRVLRLPLAWLALLLALASSACSVFAIKHDVDLVESRGTLRGQIERPPGAKGEVVVGTFTRKNGVYEKQTARLVHEDGKFEFSVLPDTYYIAAFVDENGDRKYQPSEQAAIFGEPTEIKVASGGTGDIGVLKITGVLAEGARADHTTVEASLSRRNIGRVTAFDDPVFADKYKSMGLWKPVQYLEEIGAGLFLLQPYEADRIPVIFVHGINGAATDWRAVIDKLDRKRYQPWVLQYPSGLDLNLVSDYFSQSVYELQKQYKFESFFVAAHSMGGLVTRSFVEKFTRDFPEQAKFLKLVITVNSPIGGIPSANFGVDYSPIVVPAWRNVASGSDFVKDLLAWHWPAEIPYHLVFTFKAGEGDDGVVPLESQIPPSLQAEAVRLYGFESEHSKLLRQDDFIELFKSILARYS